MYDKLIKRLREIHPEEFGNAWNFAFACQQAMHEAADAIEELDMITDNLNYLYKEATTWIPVTERLPESETKYLVMRFDFVTKTPFYDLLWFENGEWWNRKFKGEYAVTHWMPLPEPPKESDHEGYAVQEENIS